MSNRSLESRSENRLVRRYEYGVERTSYSRCKTRDEKVGGKRIKKSKKVKLCPRETRDRVWSKKLRRVNEGVYRVRLAGERPQTERLATKTDGVVLPGRNNRGKADGETFATVTTPASRLRSGSGCCCCCWSAIDPAAARASLHLLLLRRCTLCGNSRGWGERLPVRTAEFASSHAVDTRAALFFFEKVSATLFPTRAIFTWGRKICLR